MMKQVYVIAATLCAALLLPDAAHAAERKLLVGGFQDIVIDGDMQVNITTGKGPSGKARGDRRILDLLQLRRVSDVLTIRVQQPPNNQNNVRIKEPLVINISNRDIRDITLLGNARLTVTGMDHPGSSRINLNGGGSIEIGSLEVDQLYVALFGTGNLDIRTGSVRETELRIQGVGIYDAQNLKSRKFALEQNGNATVHAQADEGATISNSGSGNINIYGRAECLIRKAGSASIICPQDRKNRR